MTASIGEALNLLIQGFRLIGDAITIIIQIVLAGFGFNVPDWAIRLMMLGFLALAVWRYGRLIPKLVFAAIGFIFLSTLVGFILPWPVNYGDVDHAAYVLSPLARWMGCM